MCGNAGVTLGLGCVSTLVTDVVFTVRDVESEGVFGLESALCGF